MKRFAYVLLLLLVFAGETMGQFPDSIAVDERPRAAFRFLLNLDARNTAVFDRTVRFFGVRIGAWKNRDIIALGFYGLDNPVIDNSVQLTDVGRDSTNVRTALSYAGLTYERLFIDNKRWQLSVPLMVGLGNTRVEYLDSTDTYRPYARREVVPVELGVRGAYKLFFWLYIQAGVGYREVLSADHRAHNNYSGFTWSYGLSLKLGNIYRYAKGKVKEWREEHRSEDDDDGTK
jgi:hypothetical protein